MSETEQQYDAPLQGDTAAQHPAVGMVATPTNANEIAVAVLRAKNAGYQSIVAATDPSLEGVQLSKNLGADVVVPDDPRVTEEELWALLTRTARASGYPGLFRHTDLSQTIDFEASTETIADASEYVIDPEFAPRVSERPSVLAAIPAYNEADAIGTVVEQATAVADEVVVIDDGSTDDTVAEARTAGATIIEHDTNKGYGGALKTAFTEAKRAGAEHLVILDGDGQHDPADIPELVAQQEETDADIVIGSRFGERSQTDLPLYRQFGVRVVNLLTNLSLGVVRKPSRIADTQSGFRVYNRQAIESLADDDTIGDHMGASTDILYHAHRQNYRVEEFGTTIKYDVDNASSQNPVSHGLHLVSNILRTVERERPVTVLGVPGFVSAIVGIGFGYWTFSNYLATGVFPLGLAMVSIFFTLAGIFAAFTAIILHSLETHSQE